VSIVDAAADAGTRWLTVIEIEGHGATVGGTTAAYRYATQLPDDVASMGGVDDPENGTSGLWRDWIDVTGFPDPLKERAPFLGGMPKAGSLNVILTDIADTLTSEWKIDADPATLIAVDITGAETTVKVADASNLSTGDLVWVGSEVIELGTKSSNTFSGCTRGALNTAARPHFTDDQVFTSINYLRGRSVAVYLTFAGATAYDATNRYLLGEYSIAKYPPTPDMGAYHLSCKSEIKILGREIAAGVDYRGRVDLSVPVNADFVKIEWERGQGAGRPALRNLVDVWGDSRAYFAIDKEIVIAEPSVGARYVRLTDRAQFDTKRGESPPKDQSDVRLVLAADVTGPSSFRWSSSNSTTRASGFEKSANWVDIMLCLLTSSAHEDDGLELVNGDATYGNWSSLPIGYGIGIPADRVDFESFAKIRQITRWFNLPWFYVGHEVESFAEVLDKFFLRPIGAYFSLAGGKVTLQYPRIPVVNSTATQWTTAEILEKSTRGTVRALDLAVDQDTSTVFGAVEFVREKPDGGTDRRVYRDSDFDGWHIARSYYRREDKPLQIELRGVRTTDSAVLDRLAVRKLYRTRRVPDTFTLSVGLDQYDRVPGDIVKLTHPKYPDRSTGTRGVTDMLCEITAREIPVRPDSTHYAATLVSFGPALRIGRIPPSASIASFSGSGPYVVTVISNRYTQTDAVGDLPVTDAAAFTVGDVVMLLNLDGSDAGSSTTATITTISGSDITIDGNFGGALAAAKVIAYATRADAVAQQSDSYVFVASEQDAPPDIGTSGDRPWRWGE